MSRSGLRYHQVLVSPRLGGAESLAIEIHKYLTAQGDSSELLVPADSDVEKRVAAESLRFRTYQFEGLLQQRRLPSLLANLDLLGKLGRANKSVLHVHAP